MITIGDTFYFADISLGKITKHKLVKVNGDVFYFSSNWKANYFSSNWKAKVQWLHINPSVDDYKHSYTSITSEFYESNKTFLIFTEVEIAQKFINEYILPDLIEKQKEKADLLIEKYNNIIKKTENLESQLINNTKNFNKKCNALKKKFV